MAISAYLGQRTLWIFALHLAFYSIISAAWTVVMHRAPSVVDAPLPTGRSRNRAVLEFVRVTRQIAEEKDIAFLNLNRKMGVYVEDHDNFDEMMPDGLHLTPKGYSLMGTWVFEFIAPALQYTNKGM